MVTATNPATGEKVELVNGQWVPLGKGGATTGPKPRPDWGPGAVELPNGAIVHQGPRGGATVLQKAPLASGQAGSDAPGDLKEYQVKAGSQAVLMDQAITDYDQARRDGYNPNNPMNAVALGVEGWPGVGPFLADVIRDKPSERGRAAELTYTEGALRALTGAAATDPETRRTARNMFRQPGESDAVEPTKRMVRDRFAAQIKRAAGAAYITPQNTTVERPAGWTRALPAPQRQALRKYYGTKDAPGSQGNPFVPRNAEEFRRFPKGSYILDDDGTVFQK